MLKTFKLFFLHLKKIWGTFRKWFILNKRFYKYCLNPNSTNSSVQQNLRLKTMKSLYCHQKKVRKHNVVFAGRLYLRQIWKSDYKLIKLLLVKIFISFKLKSLFIFLVNYMNYGFFLIKQLIWFYQKMAPNEVRYLRVNWLNLTQLLNSYTVSHIFITNWQMISQSVAQLSCYGAYLGILNRESCLYIVKEGFYEEV